MTYAPQSLLDARHYLQAHTGLDATSLGIVGDVQHGTSGYHVGWDRLVLGAGTGDYSYRESVRDHVQTDAASALDIGDGWSRWRELTLWIVEQCRAGAPDTRDIREVIYTPDGVTVRRWDRLGIRSSGDSSHLTHTHISYFRDSEGHDKTALFRRFFEGDDMTMTADQDAALSQTWADNVALRDGTTAPAAARRAAGPHWLVEQTRKVAAGIDRLTAMADAEQVRDAALKAAFDAIAAAGTSVDTAAVLAAINDLHTEFGTQLVQLQDELDKAQQERDELQQRLAAALTTPAS